MANAYDKIMDSSSVDLWQEISRVLLLIMYSLLTKAVTGYHYVKDKLIEYQYADTNVNRPAARYYLATDQIEFHETDMRVPEDCIYIEEWVDAKGNKRNVVRYEGEEIPHAWPTTPFETPAKCPWVWVGDRETEVDLTRTFGKFLVPGNRIEADLVCKLVKITDHTNLIYIETGTFKEVKFPGDGITIEADVD